MSSKLTRKINGKWDWNSLEGECVGGIVCHTCGTFEIITYRREDGYFDCAECFQGDKETAERCWMGELK